jgi:hypothetical protein
LNEVQEDPASYLLDANPLLKQALVYISATDTSGSVI